MWPFKPKVKSPVTGKVISTKVGPRCRVAIRSDAGVIHYIFCRHPTVKINQNIKQGQAIGLK